MIQKKVCMVGSYGVGKTSLVKRFVQSVFDERYLTTVGVKIDKKALVVNGQQMTLMIWDLAGEDELAQVRLSHLRGASGYILVVDGCRRATLDKAIELQQRVTVALGTLPFVLVINKADLRGEWEIDTGRVEKLAQQGWTTCETSAKTGAGVEGMFVSLGGKILEGA
jgi:hypothetical protein